MDLPLIIRDRLTSLERRRLTRGHRREAAVLIPVLERSGEPHFVLTRRTNDVRTHKGQISFPGGMRHGKEDLEQTALRETFEEVGIPGEQIELLGRFHDYVSITDYLVAPFTGYLHGPLVYRPQPAEVSDILEVPFRLFREPGNLRVEERIYGDRKIDVVFYRHGEHEIWGLTARIIKDFLDTLE